jgi:hypothetical protein
MMIRSRIAAVAAVAAVSALFALAFALALALALAPRAADARPKIKPPTLAELYATDMVAKAHIRWARVEPDGRRTVVEISGGVATRVNPGWSPEPAHLPYDLAKNRKLVDAIKSSRLPAPSRRAPRTGDRVLEVLGEGEDWVVVASWSMPLAAWQKGSYAGIAELLEPLFKVQADVFDTMKGEPK